MLKKLLDVNRMGYWGSNVKNCWVLIGWGSNVKKSVGCYFLLNLPTPVIEIGKPSWPVCSRADPLPSIKHR